MTFYFRDAFDNTSDNTSNIRQRLRFNLLFVNVVHVTKLDIYLHIGDVPGSKLSQGL